MEGAVKAVREGRMGSRAAAKQYGVPRTTLQRRVADNSNTEKVIRN